MAPGSAARGERVHQPEIFTIALRGRGRIGAVLALVSLLVAGAAVAAPFQLASGVRAPHSTPDQRGFADRLVSEAFARLGHRVEVIQLPAQRALVEANEGILDGDLMRVREIPDAFPNLRRVPETLVDFDFMAFTRHLRLRPRGWESIKSHEVGIVAGWKILERNLHDSRHLIKVEDTRQLMRVLVADRVDLVVSERWQGLQAILDLDLGGQGIVMAEPAVKSRRMYLMLHRRHEALIPELVRVLREIKADGTYRRLFDEVFGPLAGAAR